eukprot:scaffold141066_cov23-Tisochrysis_lutea.AAC.2
MKSLPWRKYRGASAIEAGKGTFKSTWSPSFACRSAQRRPQAGLRATTIPDAAAPYSPPSTPQPAPNSTGSATVYIPSQKTHSLHARGFEVINGLEDWAEQKLLRYLKPVQSSWQPQDLLPEPSSPDFYDQVQELRRGAQQLPNDYLVVLVGDMVTEEALPSYMSMLNTLDCTKVCVCACIGQRAHALDCATLKVPMIMALHATILAQLHQKFRSFKLRQDPNNSSSLDPTKQTKSGPFGKEH